MLIATVFSRRSTARILAVGACLGLLTAGIGGAQQRVREIIARGDSIPGQLQPDDEVVLVRRLAEKPQRVDADSRLSFKDEIRDLADTGHAVIEVEVAHVDPRLVNNDSWVLTDITLRLIQTLRATDDWLARFNGKTELSMKVDGGEVLVDHVVVRAGDYPLFRTGRRYIVGAYVQRDGAVFTNPIFAVDQMGRIAVEATWSSETRPPQSPLHGRTIEAIARELASIK